MESRSGQFDPHALSESLRSKIPEPLRRWTPLIILVLIGAIVVLVLLGAAPYLVIGLALAYQWYKRKQNVNPLSGVSPSPVARQRLRSARLIALVAIIFSFSPLIVAAAFPLSEEATREGADMRPFLTFVTLPIGVVIAMISLTLGKKSSRGLG